MEKQALDLEDLNQDFYKENESVQPLYDDLKTTRVSESQIRIALLQCLKNAIETGDFDTAVEDIKSEATVRKCYDSSNWGNNFNNNSGLFDLETYGRDVQRIALSEQGKSELAKVIKELA